MAKVTLTIATKQQAFPRDTVETSFTFTILNKAEGSTPTQQKSDGVSAVFNSVAAGDYTATVSKLGVEVSADFTVEAEQGNTVDFEVPDSLSVSVSPDN